MKRELVSVQRYNIKISKSSNVLGNMTNLVGKMKCEVSKKVVLVYIKVNKKVKITDISTNLFDVSQVIVLLSTNFQ